MRVRHSTSRLLLLLIPSLAASTLIASSSPNAPLDQDSPLAPAAGAAASSKDLAADSSVASQKKFDVGTKDAPYDGKDGKPHDGPFVELDSSKTSSDTSKGASAAKDRPADRIIVDGKKIPDSNDGVMDDKNRPGPKEGTRGTEGGVSEKDKARKMQEGMTGEKAENRPQTPKEVPPLPHTDAAKAVTDKESKDGKDGKPRADGKFWEDVTGIEKPLNLPDKTHETKPPLPDSANKDHLEVTKGTGPKTTHATAEDGNDGLIRPFHSFLLSFTMILFSEIGDKTFLVAALMAMKHERMVVFSAALGALVAMTVLSAALGHTVPSLIPKRLTSFLAAAMFLVDGGRMLRDGLAMSPDEGVSAEMQEVEMELEEKEKQRDRRRAGSVVSPYALEGGLLGNRSSRQSRPKSRFPTPPRSPSSSPDGPGGSSPSQRAGVSGAVSGFLAGLNNLFSLLLSPAWVQTFAMTFLGEWGDRSQIATIAMAAGQDYWWVTLGAGVGHACCTGVAVLGGRAIAGRVSLKVVTVGGAIAFLVFGVIYLIEALYT